MRHLFTLSLILSLLTIAACSSEQAEQAATADQATIDSLPSLQAELDAKKVAFEQASPAERVALFEKGVTDVAESGVLESALQVGDLAPDFTLPAASGDSVTLSKLLMDGPVILTWYRGGWCPYCNIQLQALNAAMPQVSAAGGQIIAISPEIPDSSLSTANESALGFPVVSDVGNEVARDYGIVYVLPTDIQDAFAGRLDIPAYNADSSMTLPLAVTYIIDTDRLIKYACVDPDYRKRAEPAALVAFLRQLQAGNSGTAQ